MTPDRTERPSLGHSGQGRGVGIGSPGFGGGVSVYFGEPGDQTGHTLRMESPPNRPQLNRPPSTPRIPPEDNVPKGCSRLSMEPLHEWVCKGADVTSPAEYEAALYQLEEYPLDIRQYNDNIREKRWTHFSLEGVRFPTATVDVMQKGEALAIFERDLIIHFQQISKAAALYVRALLGGVKQTFEVYRRVDETTPSYPWSQPTTEEVWHAHAEGVCW